jgi:hypothetical protein
MDAGHQATEFPAQPGYFRPHFDRPSIGAVTLAMRFNGRQANQAADECIGSAGRTRLAIGARGACQQRESRSDGASPCCHPRGLDQPPKRAYVWHWATPVGCHADHSDRPCARPNRLQCRPHALGNGVTVARRILTATLIIANPLVFQSKMHFCYFSETR